MPGTSSQAEVQRRLAEMDARLRAMQEELERDLSVAESPAEPAPAEPAGVEPAEPVDVGPAEPVGVEPADTGSGPGAPEPSVAVRGSAPARELRQRAPRLFPPQPPAPRQPQPQPEADPRLEAMCARLLRSMQELLAGYEIALGHVAARPDSGDAAVTLAAGPFSRVEMVAEFERALAGLPHVAEVALRGYEGSDRAIIEVQLRG